MKKLNFSYEVRYSFSQPVTGHCYALRILPVTNEEQGIYASEYTISGGGLTYDGQTGAQAVGRLEGSGSVVTDGFGNRVVTGSLREPHDSLTIQITGTAYTDRGRPRKWEARPAPLYRFATDLTRPGPVLTDWYRENVFRIHMAAGENTRERAVLWMQVVVERFLYIPGITGIDTTAESAAQDGRGVCQDYAQILIALLRMDGIPSRYIAGMMRGEGATHAWCEAWCDGFWIGLDPTHGCELDENYIEVARGRDYRDCIMDRGRFQGYASQSQEVIVKVTENIPTPVGRWGLL